MNYVPKGVSTIRVSGWDLGSTQVERSIRSLTRMVLT